MKNKSKIKKQHIGKDDTIFEINNSNGGQIDLSQFRTKPKFADSQKHNNNKNNKNRTNNSAKIQNNKDNGNIIVRRNNRKGKVRKNVGSESWLKEPVGLRVVGGKFRGSRLVYVGDNRVRPMKDRVREAVFNLIGTVVCGKRVIDLFGGTGALAIEAISRGAVAATVIEMHLPTAVSLRKNLESLNLQDVCQLCKTDAFFWAKNREMHPNDDIAWLVFCSPPYSFYIEREKEILEMLCNLIDSAPFGSIFVIESDNRFDFDRLPIKPLPNKIRSYPPAEIAIFTKTELNYSAAEFNCLEKKG
ncbi:MAG: RsmD family RNA methyltransferase [Planctomycetaceae bacterium]|jgi:16S rRNA (guanine966-N2)-methyltransferase|nr:RsmD family RNA methyltransferase [Planctomycetaceae bacterium]